MRLNSWVQYWFQPVDSRVYKLVRVAYSVVALLNIIQIFPDRYELLSDQGLIGIAANELLYRNTYSLFWIFSSPTSVDVILLIAAFTCVALGFNFFARTASIVLFLWSASYVSRIGFAATGWDLLLVAIGFQLMIGPLGQKNSTSPVYALRLIQFQVALMYVHAVLSKLQDPIWRDGSAAATFFMGSVSLIKNPFWAYYPFLSPIATYSCLLTETAIPFLLWKRKTRPYGFLIGYGFHGLLLVTTNIPLFSLVVMTSYLAFLTAEDLDRIQQIARKYLPLKWLPFEIIKQS